jgi:small subunit ribosomal protein S6
MRHYETIFIINPELTDEDYKAVLSKFNTLVEKLKGVMIKVEEWGKQRLAYTVKKFDRGSYVLFNYCGESGVPAELERDLKLDDRVIKFQTVKLADSADPEELIRKAQDAKKETPKEEIPEPEGESIVEATREEETEEVQNGNE